MAALPCAQASVKTKARDLRDNGIDLEVLPLNRDSGRFDYSIFYEHLVDYDVSPGPSRSTVRVRGCDGPTGRPAAQHGAGCPGCHQRPYGPGIVTCVGHTAFAGLLSLAPARSCHRPNR